MIADFFLNIVIDYFPVITVYFFPAIKSCTNDVLCKHSLVMSSINIKMNIEVENINCLQHLQSLSTPSFLQPTTPTKGIAAQQTSAFFTGSIQMFDWLLSAQSALPVRWSGTCDEQYM